MPNVDENWTSDPPPTPAEYWLLSPPSATGQQLVRATCTAYLTNHGWLRSILPIPVPQPPPLPSPPKE
jgi:hypothetical protein